MLSFITRHALAGSLILSGVLSLGLAYTRYELNSAKEVIQGLVEWQDGIVETTRLAAGSPEITVKTARSEIQHLGNLRIELKAAISTQNEAIGQLVRETEMARQVAAQAQAQKEAAIKRSEKLRIELIERAGTPVPAENMERAVRDTQDELYEAGL